jgi:hypothetical protein
MHHTPNQFVTHIGPWTARDKSFFTGSPDIFFSPSPESRDAKPSVCNAFMQLSIEKCFAV